MVRNRIRGLFSTAPVGVCALLLLLTRPSIEGLQSSAASLPMPTFTVDESWPKLPTKWRFAQVSSISVDKHNHTWILQRPRSLAADQKAMAAPPVLEFDHAGNFLQGWGGADPRYEWPQIEHGLLVDQNDHVWIGGAYCPDRKLPGLEPVSDDQLLKFTRDGKFLMQIGRANKSGGNRDTENLRQPADVFLFAKTSELFVADGYGNRRVIVLDAGTGKFKRMWGAFGKAPVDSYECPPVYDRHPPSESGRGPDQYHVVHGVKISQDELVYVADRSHARVQVFTIDGKFVNQVVISKKLGGSAGSIAFSPAPAQEYLYIGAGGGVAVLNRKTLELLGTVPAGGAHQITSDAAGNLYTAEVGPGGLLSTGGRARRFLVSNSGRARQ